MTKEHLPDVTNFIRGVRSVIFRHILRKRDYYLFNVPEVSKRSMEAISKKYGYDRGKPVDRYYIEKFIEQHSDDIKGKCLEVTDNHYTVTYGGKKVTQADALDIDTSNKKANLYGDLRDLKDIKDNTYDCLIVTQTYVMIDDYEAAIRESLRVLKPGGVLLATMPCLSPVWNIKYHHWRFTKASGEYVFGKIAGKENVQVNTYGNTLVGQAFWVGMSMNDLTVKEYQYNDPFFPVIVTIRVVKK